MPGQEGREDPDCLGFLNDLLDVGDNKLRAAMFKPLIKLKWSRRSGGCGAPGPSGSRRLGPSLSGLMFVRTTLTGVKGELQVKRKGHPAVSRSANRGCCLVSQISLTSV